MPSLSKAQAYYKIYYQLHRDHLLEQSNKRNNEKDTREQIRKSQQDFFFKKLGVKTRERTF